MSTVSIPAEKGAALQVVNDDGSVDVWNIPQGATIDVTGQRGFGDAEQVVSSTSATDSAGYCASIISSDGAL